MILDNLSLGKFGERLAGEYLQKHYFKILARNFRTNFGELDIIAEKKSIVYFVEVKTRIGDSKGEPYEAVTHQKLLHTKRAAEVYILTKNIEEGEKMLAVVSIILNEDYSVKSLEFYELD